MSHPYPFKESTKLADLEIRMLIHSSIQYIPPADFSTFYSRENFLMYSVDPDHTLVSLFTFMLVILWLWRKTCYQQEGRRNPID